MQELKVLIPELTPQEIGKHERELKLVTNKINYTLLKGELEQEYMIQEAREIVEQIKKALNTKANQLV